jgi:hypothetical protein
MSHWRCFFPQHAYWHVKWIYMSVDWAQPYPYNFASRYPFDTFSLQSANLPHSKAHLQNSGPILSRNHSPKSLEHSVSVSELEPGSQPPASQPRAITTATPPSEARVLLLFSSPLRLRRSWTRICPCLPPCTVRCGCAASCARRSGASSPPPRQIPAAEV